MACESRICRCSDPGVSVDTPCLGIEPQGLREFGVNLGWVELLTASRTESGRYPLNTFSPPFTSVVSASACGLAVPECEGGVSMLPHQGADAASR